MKRFSLGISIIVQYNSQIIDQNNMDKQIQTKILSASKVKYNFGAIVKQIQSGKYKAVVVENHGKPTVAIIAIEELETIREYNKQKRREKALELLSSARDDIQSRLSKKLNDKEALEVADNLSREMFKDLAKHKKVKFKRKSV